MSAGTAARSGTGATGRGWTPAQWFCVVVGTTLVLAGLLGFIADATFDTGASSSPDAEGGNQGGGLQGDSFLGLEVNGWHNIVHLLTGLLLLYGARAGQAARPIVLIFGAAYALVTLIGLIDGDDVLGLIPVNPADNVLHIVLTLGAFASAFMTRDDKTGDRIDHRGVGEDRTAADARGGVAGAEDPRRGTTGATDDPGHGTAGATGAPGHGTTGTTGTDGPGGLTGGTEDPSRRI